MPVDPSTLHVVRRAELLARGLTRSALDAEVATGRLIRLGRSWYGDERTPADVAAALRRGTRLTCVSALRHHGLWTPLDPGRHEAAHRRASTETPPGVVGHGILRRWPDDGPILPAPLALDHLARCLGARDDAILFESAAHTGLVPLWQIDDILAGLPQRTRKALGRIDHRAESGTETVVRRFFERMGVQVEPQARIDHVGRVDLRVGERLIVECDSRAHHTSEAAYAEERRRDLQPVLMGYVVVRLTWADVMLHGEATEVLLRELIRTGRHRVARSRRGSAHIVPSQSTRPVV